MVHTALALCNIMLLGTFLWPKSNYVPNAIPTPFQEAISYKLDVLGDDVRLTDNGTVVPHYDRERGPPSPELEAAWDELLQYSNIRLSRDELGADFRDNPALVELSDGSGIYSSAAVFHSIHCIKRVRYMLYPEHYHANKTTEEMDELKKHAGASVVFDTGIKLIEDTEHCLNYLLHSAKCNADLTVFPMQWGAGQRIPFGIDQGRHQCKDWDRIQDWAKQRSFDIYKPGLIMHPTLGWAYADGVEMVTGVANDTLLADTLEKEE
ncbi:hypothetical protein ATEIFO6365_0009042900 [Aspergillus terreus]|uniref:Uncharacterized protein n=1 Tax=Aspergillus terreus TaxID=33178 RepID=A0A5M3ZBZ4_ASPTE|nr:hypothetical protein ATETN484_0011042400 [Aspergillus terreus]GFF19066.1 hypothetical protein ATEIFO6365_0009042900 [Aspergillus terreus]